MATIVKPICPCVKGCKLRQPDCRGTCEPFQQYEKLRMEYYELKDKARILGAQGYEYLVDKKAKKRR